MLLRIFLEMLERKEKIMSKEENARFDEVDIAEYVKMQTNVGWNVPMEAYKFARISARKGILGEEIKTIMADGLEETVNTVQADPNNGELGWVVTNPGGEQYIVPDETFKKKYEVDPENPEMYKPKGGPVMAMQIWDNISFKAPWGEMMNIRAGGYLIINSDTDIYGIQEEEFNNTYKFTDLDEPKKAK